MIPKRRVRQKMGTRVSSVVRSPSHLQWVRGHACIVAKWHGHFCAGRIEAHHVYLPGDAKGRKPGDDQVIPLCAAAHEEGHRIGWEEFDRRYGLRINERIETAEWLWGRSPAGARYRMKMETVTR